MGDLHEENTETGVFFPRASKRPSDQLEVFRALRDLEQRAQIKRISPAENTSVNTFLNILLLLNNKHVVVEELLKLFINKINRDLFKTIVLKDLKASNVKHSTEVSLLKGGIN